MNQAQRYATLERQRKGHGMDCSYRAAFLVLSSTASIYEVAKCHVSEDGINFRRMKQQSGQLDESARYAIDVAHNLFSYDSPCTATPYAISRLEAPYMNAVCNAIYVASG